MTSPQTDSTSALGPRPSALPIGIGLIGCGTVGAGVVKLLQQQGEVYAQRLGRKIELRKVLVRSKNAERDCELDPSVLTIHAEELFDDPQIKIIVEVAGGIEPVRSYVTRALESGRHVVTANKALLAAHGVELFTLARKHRVCIAFEASCGGTIPMLMAIKFGLSANRVDAIYGILNGTCNYILTQMSEAGWSYADALKDAQAKGYAEADPTLDVSGADAAQKLAIVASLAFGAAVNEKDVSYTGIDKLQAEDIAFGRELGYVVKLLAIAQRKGAGVILRVQPCFVHANEPIAQVRHAFNALSVFGHASGHVMLYGRGAGQMPTASAVVSDLLNVAADWYPQAFAGLRIWPDQHKPLKAVDVGQAVSRYYFRIAALDKPGVIARVAKVLGDHHISISAIVQHENNNDGFVPVVITTHQTSEKAVVAAADEMAGLDVIRGRPACIRIVDLPES